MNISIKSGCLYKVYLMLLDMENIFDCTNHKNNIYNDYYDS